MESTQFKEVADLLVIGEKWKTRKDSIARLLCQEVKKRDARNLKRNLLDEKQFREDDNPWCPLNHQLERKEDADEGDRKTAPGRERLKAEIEAIREQFGKAVPPETGDAPATQLTSQASLQTKQ